MSLCVTHCVSGKTKLTAFCALVASSLCRTTLDNRLFTASHFRTGSISRRHPTLGHREDTGMTHHCNSHWLLIFTFTFDQSFLCSYISFGNKKVLWECFSFHFRVVLSGLVKGDQLTGHWSRWDAGHHSKLSQFAGETQDGKMASIPSPPCHSTASEGPLTMASSRQISVQKFCVEYIVTYKMSKTKIVTVLFNIDYKWWG